MGVDALLERSAERSPDKIAVVCAGERRSYGELNAQANRIAHALIDAGLQPGDRVAICLGNSIEAVASLFGVLKAGGVFFIVNPHARADYLARLIADSGALTLIASAETIAALDLAGRGLSALKTFSVFDAPGAPSTPPRQQHGDTDLAALVYTSGSTGEPKGVMLTHRNMMAAATAICSYLENTSDDVILNALPLAFTYGLGQITTAFQVGATVVLERGMTYPRAALDTMIRERVTGLPLVPTMATLLLQQDIGTRRFPELRYITNAAAPLPAAKIRRLCETFPGARIYSMYGQTECQRISYLPPDQIDLRPTSVGIPIPGTEAWIVDDRGERVAPGVVGELVVRGPHVMTGYWRQPEATAGIRRPGASAEQPVLHTGDLFRSDAEGFLYFVARKDDIIKTRGEKVAPAAIEEVIALLPGVADVAVYGIPDEVLGEAIAAVVVPMPGALLTGDGIQRHCLRHVEAFMVPKVVDIRDSLPKTMSGKVSRRALRAMASDAGRVCA